MIERYCKEQYNGFTNSQFIYEMGLTYYFRSTFVIVISLKKSEFTKMFILSLFSPPLNTTSEKNYWLIYVKYKCNIIWSAFTISVYTAVTQDRDNIFKLCIAIYFYALDVLYKILLMLELSF
ncbi:hypothetical protein V1477_017608 [Vespula maculifrons]|uniref:Uncharacterized protein n=1 Tax=Vespula maculifrons TaxID=7453 RepID=A0ABD2B6J5_VESMC